MPSSRSSMRRRRGICAAAGSSEGARRRKYASGAATRIQGGRGRLQGGCEWLVEGSLPSHRKTRVVLLHSPLHPVPIPRPATLLSLAAAAAGALGGGCSTGPQPQLLARPFAPLRPMKVPLIDSGVASCSSAEPASPVLRPHSGTWPKGPGGPKITWMGPAAMPPPPEQGWEREEE